MTQTCKMPAIRTRTMGQQQRHKTETQGCVRDKQTGENREKQHTEWNQGTQIMPQSAKFSLERNADKRTTMKITQN